MRVIGLTGGIATGKSTVARLLAELGAHVIDADQVAREVVEPGRPAFDALVETFGAGVLTADGRLDRAALARRVFADPEARRRLNAITHPPVRAEFARRLAALRERGREPAPRAVVLDVPLLFEAGMDDLCHEIWVVWARPATQEARLQARDGLAADEAEARIASQLPLAEKCARADVIIDNDGSRAAAERQVQAAWVTALRRAKGGAEGPADDPVNGSPAHP